MALAAPALNSKVDSETTLEPDAEYRDESQSGWKYDQFAAFYADLAAKQADNCARHVTELAQWVHILWNQLHAMTSKVEELEAWKNKTLQDMRKLREEHKQLQKRCGVLKEPLPKYPSAPLEEEKPKLLEQAEPIKPVSAPPGLEFPGPQLPTLELIKTDESMVSSKMDDEDFDDMAMTVNDGGGTQGIVYKDKIVDGVQVRKAEWKIGRLSAQLRGCMGRALVSPPMSVWGLEEMRLMIFPDQKEMQRGPRSRKQKELYNKKVTDGPLESCLKLKVPNCPVNAELKFWFTVGEDEQTSTVFQHNFSELSVSEACEFADLDWLKKVDENGGLTVSVEIEKVPGAL